MFVSILGEPPHDLEVQGCADEPGLIVAIPIAEEVETNRVVLLETTLSPAIVDEFEFHEIAFQFTVISLDDSFEPFTTQMRDQARQYLPPECIPHILDLVGESCEKLIETARPMLVYYVAKERDLPSKALEKYDLLTWYVQWCGYTLYERGTDALDREFWKLSAPFQPE